MPEGASESGAGHSDNLAQKKIDYRIEDTRYGKWKIYVYPSGESYREYATNAAIGSWPLVHVTLGKCPETGSRKTAMGIIAIGRFAVGAIAIAQAALGLVTVAQAGVGLVFLCQAGLGWSGIAQVCVAYQFAIGQVAVGTTAIGQVAVGKYALGQVAAGVHVLSVKTRDPEAVMYFTELWHSVKGIIGW